MTNPWPKGSDFHRQEESNEDKRRAGWITANGEFRIPLRHLDAHKPWWGRRWIGYGYGGDLIEPRLMPFVEWLQGDGTYERERP
jgi:hypothetical protein